MFNPDPLVSYQTIIAADNPEIAQPEYVEQTMFIHQRKAVSMLLSIEKDHTISGQKYDMRTNIGIFADKIGAGKTLTMCTLLSMKIDPEPRKNPIYGSSKHFSVIVNHTRQTNELLTNLIIVPHNLINQWKDTLELIKNVSFKIVSKIKHVEEFNSLLNTNVDIPDVILVVNTMYKNLQIPNKFTWKRFIIDEPQLMVLPVDNMPKADFTWLMCATPRDVLHGRRTYLKGLIRPIYDDDQRNLANQLVIKNSDTDVDSSIRLTAYVEKYIICKSSRFLEQLGPDNLPMNALACLQANDVSGAIELLNCKEDSCSNIVESLIRNYQVRVHNLKLESHRIEHTLGITSDEREMKLEVINEKIKGFDNKIKCIKERIENTTDSMCPICLDTISEPRAITNCCQNSFCFECIVMALGANPSRRCAMCKKPDCCLHVESCKNSRTSRNDNGPKSKADILLDILINMNSGSRYLVFSEYSNSFERVMYRLNEMGIKYETLRGRVETQQKIIDRYSKGETQILLLNAAHFGTGINLQMTTDIVIYHKLRNTNLRTQIIGRAQRPGRNVQLNVTYLRHENEGTAH